MIKHIMAYFGYYKKPDLYWVNLEQWNQWILSHELTKLQGEYLIELIRTRIRRP